MPLKPISLETVSRIAALVIGEAGMGKTSLLWSLCGFDWKDGAWIKTGDPLGKVCVLSAESGLLSVRDLVAQNLVEGFEIRSVEDMREAYQMFRDGTDHKWIFIDSLTEIGARCADHFKAKYPGENNGFKLWGEYSDTMTGLVKGFRDLTKYNVVFTCLPQVDKDENNCRYIAPAMAGTKLKERLPSYFDEVLYMAIEQHEEFGPRRAFFTQSNGRYPAKDRSGKLAPVDKPDLAHIYRKIIKEAA